MLTLVAIVGMIGVALWTARSADAHRPGLHAAGSLEAPKHHWLVYLRQATNGEARERCRPRPVRSVRPAAAVPEFARVWTIRVELTRLSAYRLLGSRCLPTTWAAAVAWAQKPFPGTASWLWSCSGSEGGSRGFIMNRQGSGAGGWLQFMAGTFYSNVDNAFAASRRHGHPVPAGARSWFQPLGQALTGAYMLLIGQRHQWSGAGC